MIIERFEKWKIVYDKFDNLSVIDLSLNREYFIDSFDSDNSKVIDKFRNSSIKSFLNYFYNMELDLSCDHPNYNLDSKDIEQLKKFYKIKEKKNLFPIIVWLNVKEKLCKIGFRRFLPCRRFTHIKIQGIEFFYSSSCGINLEELTEEKKDIKLYGFSNEINYDLLKILCPNIS